MAHTLWGKVPKSTDVQRLLTTRFKKAFLVLAQGMLLAFPVQDSHMLYLNAVRCAGSPVYLGPQGDVPKPRSAQSRSLSDLNG